MFEQLANKFKAIINEAKRKQYMSSPEYREARGDREFLMRVIANRAYHGLAMKKDCSYADWLRQVSAVKSYREGNMEAAAKVLH